MNKRLIIFVNIGFVLAILAFVALYTQNEARSLVNTQTTAFENMTETMEQVTTNYLVGEQRLCDSWANTINNSDMDMDAAIDFLMAARTMPEITAHLIYLDDGSLSGRSTQAHTDDAGDDGVSYLNTRLIGVDAVNHLLDSPIAVKLTRAYTNPINGVQSIAFLNRVTLKEDGRDRTALLLRVVPVSSLQQGWVFPTSYANAEICMIEHSGNYIIKGNSFKNASFFEFYRSYNATDPAKLSALESQVISEPGSLRMFNASGQDCLAAHTPVSSTENWTIVTLVPMQDLIAHSDNWRLIGVVSAGLLLLLVFDVWVMQRYNRRLSVMAAAAAAANQAKTDFLSTMSHDIRTPMNAIIGLTAIAAKNAGDEDAVKENLKKINLASNHLLTLINDILDISKVESGKLTMSPVTFSIVESTENLVNISQPMVKEKNIDFNFRINRFEHEYLYADQLRVNQIYINLLSNAIKYTEPGGRVDVDLREEPGSSPGTVKLIYRVADTGIGMTPEFMARMYQPFSRQTDSRVNSIQGTGLGLAITKQMIELMGGDIQCESQLGVGTTFTVTLEIPLADKLVDEMKLEPMRVLIADDDAVLLETARDTLASIGAQADTASGGAQALEMVRRQHGLQPDYRVVILDWKMPDLDGVEAARRIRAELGPDVPILVISAYDWSEIEDDARAAGVNGFISKPLFRSTLYEKITELLGLNDPLQSAEDDDADVQGMRVLVAEDNDVNWEIISMLLQMHGIESERVENGKLCLERLAAMQPGEFDLVFMDIQMPVMNGLEAARHIRRLRTPAADIPIIAMTADAFSENVAACLEAGMNGHIAKPVDMKLVMKEIRRIREGQA